MAPVEVVSLIESSPPPHHNKSIDVVETSPGPSSNRFASSRFLKPGSRAAEVPKGSFAGFQPASALNVSHIPQETHKAFKSVKRRKLETNTSICTDIESSEKVASSASSLPCRKQASKQALKSSTEGRAAGRTEERCSTLPGNEAEVLQRRIQGAVTKPSLRRRSEESKVVFRLPHDTASIVATASCTVSRDHEQQLDHDEPERKAEARQDQNTGPVPRTKHNTRTEEQTSKISRRCGTPPPRRENAQVNFDHSLPNDSAKKKSMEIAVVSTVPVRAPAKSSRTITGIAIAHAQLNSPEKPRLDAGQIAKDRITRDNAEVRVSSDQSKELGASSTTEQVPKRKRASRAKKKKEVAPPPKLLSPQAASRRAESQTFLFGTSSQLVVDDSPRQVRQLQKALEASVAYMPAEPGESSRMNDDKDDLIVLGCARARRKGNLWSAAFRDEENAVVSMESFSPRYKPSNAGHIEDKPIQYHAMEQELSDIISAETADEVPRVDTESLVEEAATPKASLKLSSSVAKRRMCFSAFRHSHDGEKQQRAPLSTLATNVQMNNEHDDDIRVIGHQLKGSGKVVVDESNENASEGVFVKAKCSDTEIGALGGDAIKPKRTRKGKNEGSAAKPKKKTESAKRKAKVAAQTESIPCKDDIEDSEPEMPSTPRRRGGSQRLTPLELSPSPTTDVATATAAEVPQAKRKRKKMTEEEGEAERSRRKVLLEEKMKEAATVQERLNPFITKAVQAAPKSNNHKHPSWHEKILLYDPIVIEDLTQWLRAGALQEAGWDVEKEGIEPLQVQIWCESHSICCLWKGGLRGGVRLPY